jgi:hypothetical protein
VITKDMAGRALDGLGAAHDRIATAMYTMDSHPAWTRVRSGLSTGATANRGQELTAESTRLWACFNALGDQVEEARAINGRRRLDEQALADLTTLLTTAVVPVDAGGTPVEPTGTAVNRLTLEQLAGQTERGCADLLSALSDVDNAWTAVTEAYVRASAELDQVAALAAELGETGSLDPARAAAAQIERLDLHDPMTSAPGGVLAPATRARLDDLAQRVAGLRRELAATVAAREGYPARRATLDRLIEQVAATEAGTAATYARVLEKIAEPALATAPAAASVLRARLVGLDALRDAGRWRQLAADLSAVENEAAAAQAHATELTAAAGELLARRDELRGRLDAFRAKAVGQGLAEDPALAALYTDAHDLLYTAPCDLRAATRAVYAYSRGLAARPSAEPSRRTTDE